MNRTNLFQELTNTNGTFIQFQNYADDLCKQIADFEGWRVVPTKYALVDIPTTLFDGKDFDEAAAANQLCQWSKPQGTAGSSSATLLPEVFQDYFENSVAFTKDNIATFTNTNSANEVSEFSDEVVKSLFWQTVERYGLIGTPGTNVAGQNTWDAVKYIGDINVISSKNYGGTQNTEIYVYVPEDAAENRYSFYSDTQDLCYKSWSEASGGDMIWGWTSDAIPSNSTLSSKPMLSAVASINGETSSNDYVFFGGCTTTMPCFDVDKEEYYTNNATTQDSESFNFNAIILFYDIESNIDGDLKKKHIGVPMGIYFLGVPTTTGVFNNSITKFVSNDDIYGQGAAYSLRICQKYLAMPNVNTLSVKTECSDDDLDDYTSVMQEFGKAHKEINELIGSEKAIRTLMEDEFARFKNWRTNVPYIKTVGNHKEWFVNGRATGVIAIDVDYVDNLLNTIQKQQGQINDLINEVTELKQTKVYWKE